MLDFTVKTYEKLLKSLISQGFLFKTLIDYIEKPQRRAIILRHDVDRLPENSLKFARLQSEMGIKGTYYFRSVPDSWDEYIIKEIVELKHEIGYHYEDFSLAADRQKTIDKRTKWNNNEDYEKYIAEIAILNFKENLMEFRKIVPVKTICMHGSPMSSRDSRLLWKYYDYHDYGIVAEPYFDIDFAEVLYLTDTGRRWNGTSFNLRDKVTEDAAFKQKNIQHRTAEQPHFPEFHSTFDIIRAAEENRLPDNIMMTFHPQRWEDRPIPWFKELFWQNIKNVGKYILIRLR